MLSARDRQFLLCLAVDALYCKLKDRKFSLETEYSGPLAEPVGAFVTLKKAGKLRGCMGALETNDPLWFTVIRMAVAAGTRDPRFSPIVLEDLEKLSVSISVLSPFCLVQNIEDIQVGRHGLLIRKGNHSGILLPQVAIERNWNREEFLQYTCKKAKLSPDEWKADAEIYMFSAEVFSGDSSELLSKHYLDSS